MRRLILRPGAIGDCILSFPAIEHLVTEYTEVWIPSSLVPLLTFVNRVRSLSSTGIDLVGIADTPIDATLKAKLAGFDSIVSWYGANRPLFREAMLQLGIPLHFLPALPPPDYPGHASKFFCDQVGAADRVPRIAISPCLHRGTIVIHPFSGGKRKNWPLSCYQALANRIDYGPVEWIAGPEEQLEVANRFGSLADLASWLAGARLYIGNDSGITHLAAAIGVPTLALFGPTDPERWAPRGDNIHILRNEPLEALAVETVLGVVNQLLSSPSTVSSTLRSAFERR